MFNESQFFGIQDPKELQFCMASVDKLHVCMTDYEIFHRFTGDLPQYAWKTGKQSNCIPYEKGT